MGLLALNIASSFPGRGQTANVRANRAIPPTMGVARNRGKSPPVEMVDGPDSIYPDGLVANDAVETIVELADGEMISDAVVETVDIFPALADLSGIPVPEGLDGQSLLPQLKDPAHASSKPAFSHWRAGERTVRDDRWRLIVDESGNRVELFDYKTDPDETRNHADDHPEVIKKMLRWID